MERMKMKVVFLMARSLILTTIRAQLTKFRCHPTVEVNTASEEGNSKTEAVAVR